MYYAAPRGGCFALGRPGDETMKPFKFPWKPLYWFLCACVLVFLLAPIAAIIPLSFSSGSFLTYPLPGLSLRWYHEVLGGGKWLSALGNSLFVGVFATVLSVLLGTLASLGLMRHKAWWSEALKLIALSPMIVPVILIAVASYFFLAPLSLTSSYTGLIIAHTVIAVPFVVVPGVSSGIPVPAYAGIPVTDRAVAGNVAFVTACRHNLPNRYHASPAVTSRSSFPPDVYTGL